MKFIIQITRGLIYDMAMRRKIMGGCLLVALLMMLAGSTFLASALAGHVWRFILYWLACAWITVLSMLLAVFDMLMIRSAALRDRVQLKKKIFLEAEDFRESQSGNGHHPDA